jgi:hypothetical protein
VAVFWFIEGLYNSCLSRLGFGGLIWTCRRFPIPPTLAQVQGYGVDIFCWCNRCYHHAVLPVAVLIALCGPAR